MTYAYSAYHLTIHADLPLPELVPIGARACDVRIRKAKLDSTFLINELISSQIPAHDQKYDRTLWLTTRGAYLAWPTVGAFWVRHGDEILYDPHPDAPDELLRLPLLGLVFAVLLHQRGVLPLHASVVAAPDHAIGFMGEKGWGKSTTAAAMHCAGYAFLSDDTLALQLDGEQAPLVLPGFPRQKLWPDAIAAIGGDPAGAPRLHAQVEKRDYAIAAPPVAEALPLRRLYVLSEGEQMEIVQLPAQEALLQLLRNFSLAPFGNQLLQTKDKAHFEHCCTVARHVPVYLLRRPRALDRLPEMVAMITAHIERERSLHAEPMAW